MDDATALIERLEAGTTTSEALLDEQLARIATHDDAIGAVVAVDEAGARTRAREADAARARGERWGPLHGLPITIKDSFEVVGMPATSGHGAWRDHRPTKHADAVQRLVDAGAIPFAKTNLPQLASEWQSFNDLHGTTHNPYDLTRTPGGSSGGAAASLAAGFSPLELGSDVGGSIRIPAHFCGVFGHKPTHGIIPLRGHLPGPPGTQSEPDLAVAGPMARSARDLSLLLDVLAGARSDEPGWTLTLPPAPSVRLDGYRVAVWLDAPSAPLEADVRDVLQHAVDALANAGMRVVDATRRLDEIEEPYVRLLAAIIGAGLPPSVLRRIRTGLPLLKLSWRLRPPTVDLLPTYLDGVLMRHRAWLGDHERRTKLRAAWATWFEEVDVLVTPVAPWAAFPHAQQGDILNRMIEVPSGQRPYLDHLRWVGPATLLGLPATTVPVGQTNAGLPVGLQVIGPRFGDSATLTFANEVERVLGGFVAPPLP